MALKRWRHFFTFLACMVVLQLVGEPLWQAVARPRPFDVTIIGDWDGWSLPPPALAFLTLVVVGIVVHARGPRPAPHDRQDRRRRRGRRLRGRRALSRDLPPVRRRPRRDDRRSRSALNAFRLFTPNEIFPVTYGGGKKAHLDVGGERGEAIRRALQDQLGLTVVDLKPVGLAGSGGSTPLRLRVAGDPDTYLFGKLYAMSHVRADRWYKLGRT